MDIQTLFQIKSKFVTRKVDNELIIVPLSGNVAQMNELFTLNETGGFIWENTSENTTTDELQNAMIEAFVIDKETAKRDIETFLKQMDILIK